MFVSSKIGALPIISAIFDHGPSAAALMMLVADFGIICLVMLLEGIPPWERGQYKTFLWNDTVWIPLYLGVATLVLQGSAPLSGFYTQTWWHVLLLIAGFAASIVIEVGAVKNGQYTMSQELSPSKLWHTFIFGVVFYWIVSSLIPVLVVLYQTRNWFGAFVVAVAMTGFFYNMYRDATLPFPRDAHLEGTWVPWHWHRRSY